MDINEILDTIKSKSLDKTKEEFKELTEMAKKDKSDFIKNTSEQVALALSYRAQGLLDELDVEILLKKYKKIAQIQANTSTIKVLMRIQKILYRILDIAIDVLVKSIVPIK